MADGGLVVDDIREGEASLHALWEKLCAEGAAEGDELLYELDFAALWQTAPGRSCCWWLCLIWYNHGESIKYRRKNALY